MCVCERERGKMEVGRWGGRVGGSEDKLVQLLQTLRLYAGIGGVRAYVDSLWLL